MVRGKVEIRAGKGRGVDRSHSLPVASGSSMRRFQFTGGVRMLLFFSGVVLSVEKT